MLNKVMLIGNLGKDPEVKTLESGKKVGRFSIATSKSYKDKSGEKKEETEWHNIVVWESLAELAEKFLGKGSRVFIEGALKTRSWDDKEGKKHYTTEIVAHTLTFLSTKKAAEETGPAPAPSAADTEDDLPF